MKNTVMMDKETLNHKAHKEHEDFFVLLNLKSKILDSNLSFCFLIFDILFDKQTKMHRKKIKYIKS